jgi:FixJ family two-component response regulator
MGLSRQRTSVDHGPTRIVVVDDDAGVRGALDRLLRVAGYQVRTFDSAEEFLRSCNPADVDCLIVDVYLGGMSGFDLYAELSTLGQAPPTVFVTAYDDAKVARMSLHSEGVACLRKPFEEDSLLAAIGSAVSEAPP